MWLYRILHYQNYISCFFMLWFRNYRKQIFSCYVWIQCQMKKWWTFDSKVGEDKRGEEPCDVSWWNWHPQGERCQGQVPKVKSILKVKEKQVLALYE